MRFCKDCGKVLNLFGDNEKEHCLSCTTHQQITKPPQKPKPRKEDDFNILLQTTLSCENNKILIKSKEGWELWSGPADSITDMQTLLQRARKIYEIRLRRQKN